MLNLFPQPLLAGSRPTRRQLLGMAAMSAGSMAGAIAYGEARSQLQPSRRGTAKSCIYIFLCGGNLWDNHGVANDVCGIDGQLTGRQQLTHRYCTPSFDQSFSALLEDLAQRGMLDETLVAVAGEFGRTPKINATGGRDHWAQCYTQLLAGGGVRGGSVWGASDAQGAYVKDAPVTPDDFAATILYAFGIHPEVAVIDQANRPVRVTSGHPITGLF